MTPVTGAASDALAAPSVDGGSVGEACAEAAKPTGRVVIHTHSPDGHEDGSPRPSGARLVIYAEGVPKPKGSLRHVGHGRLIEQVKGSDVWRQAIAAAGRAVMDGAAPWTGPVQVDAVVRVVRPKSNKGAWPVTRSSGDIDKHGRQILDALTGITWVDDSQVCTLRLRKAYVDAPLIGSVRIEITRPVSASPHSHESPVGVATREGSRGGRATPTGPTKDAETSG